MKQGATGVCGECLGVAPTQGRGLKRFRLPKCECARLVAPTQGRGLKLVPDLIGREHRLSPLHRGAD